VQVDPVRTQVDPLDQRRQQNSDPGRLQCRPNRREFGGLPEEIALRGSLQPEWLGRLDQAGGVPACSELNSCSSPSSEDLRV
jgi:hypothetical protein